MIREIALDYQYKDFKATVILRKVLGEYILESIDFDKIKGSSDLFEASNMMVEIGKFIDKLNGTQIPNLFDTMPAESALNEH